jgi:hypothetical protein
LESTLQKKDSELNAKVKSNEVKPLPLSLKMQLPPQPLKVESFKQLYTGGTSLVVVFSVTF